ncbi:type VI secretion system protein TssA [Schlesneria paludicola]|uniref:type VI secretion system protein TssA n=1 Tax=Schlesneria paludicola TaxID=360056 RepID=UPI00029B36D6|nr:type VI secretion system protein TssA [Schlesneria paludicola]
MIDVSKYLAPISPDSPSGENLEYDPIFGEMERASVGKPEQQFGATVIPAEEPNWKEVGKYARDLLGRTKDLRVAVHLARVELAQFGWRGFASVLELIRGYVQQDWETVHPQLDPDDDNDPALRVNTLESLCDADATLRPLKTYPLVSSRAVGRFSLRDIAIANGELKAPAGIEPPDWPKINAAFLDAPIDELSADLSAIKSSIDSLTEIQKLFAEKVGASSGVNFEPLKSVMKDADKVLSEQLKKRGVSLEAPAAAAEATAEGGVEGVVVANAPQRLAGEITSRDDVVMAIEKICDYYAKCEPSSPLPLLLDRCKRLVSASFLEIINEVIPEAMKQAQAIGGRKES